MCMVTPPQHESTFQHLDLMSFYWRIERKIPWEVTIFHEEKG